MLFNSFEFLVFFPIVTIAYFLLPHKFRWLHLLIASCIFYMYFVPVYILILFATIIIDYVAGILIEKAEGGRRKTFLIMSLLANIGVLAVFKYYNFFIDNINHVTGSGLPFLKIILPIGLSFHTFQAMSYTIEVYRKNFAAEKHFGLYALYVMFYPQLVAGPIERPNNVLPQFREKKTFSYLNAVAGFRLILWGLFKKVVIADRLAQFSDPVFDNPQSFPGITIAIAAFFFAFQIFCDFSGYSDIALGTARVMGFKLMTNFNKPYFSRSISEFWKRWHISLSTWFKDYLYIPLGGNRVPLPRAYFNLFFVFLISGFWHGANWTFLAWGALHGFYLIFALVTRKPRELFCKKVGLDSMGPLYNFINVATVFILVTVAWIFFRAHDVGNAVFMIKKMAGIPREFVSCISTNDISILNFPIKLRLVYTCLLLIVLLEAVHVIQLKAHGNNLLDKLPLYFRWGVYYTAIAMIIFLGVYEDKMFIYFQF